MFSRIAHIVLDVRELHLYLGSFTYKQVQTSQHEVTVEKRVHLTKIVKFGSLQLPLRSCYLFHHVKILPLQESEIGTEKETEQSEYESATEDNEVGTSLTQ